MRSSANGSSSSSVTGSGSSDGSDGSSSNGSSIDGGQSIAAAFISTVLQELTPEVLADWRADLALALLRAAARLKLQPSQVGTGEAWAGE